MTAWMWALPVVTLIGLLGLVVFAVSRKHRTERLRTGFGPEYERAVGDTGDKRRAEAELDRRTKRRSTFDVQQLTPESRERYSREWQRTQAHFVDEPVDAVADADQQIMRVMRERGYPIADFEQRAADISVDHPQVVEEYRAAHEVAERAAAGEATTEDLRVAMVHYRALFDDLLKSDDDSAQQSIDSRQSFASERNRDTEDSVERQPTDDAQAPEGSEDADTPTESTMETKR
jgi:hypothetical protein